MSGRKARLEQLSAQGYRVGKQGGPCEAPTTRELERAAWEIGYRAGKEFARMEEVQIRAHQAADAACGRDWNSEHGCACALCRVHRAKGGRA